MYSGRVIRVIAVWSWDGRRIARSRLESFCNRWVLSDETEKECSQSCIALLIIRSRDWYSDGRYNSFLDTPEHSGEISEQCVFVLHSERHVHEPQGTQREIHRNKAPRLEIGDLTWKIQRIKIQCKDGTALDKEKLTDVNVIYQRRSNSCAEFRQSNDPKTLRPFSEQLTYSWGGLACTWLDTREMQHHWQFDQWFRSSRKGECLSQRLAEWQRVVFTSTPSSVEVVLISESIICDRLSRSFQW